uniref:Centrosomal protein of 164 kDa-like n=1 Tax=Nicotiana tabacum TaxID=4097 RepID=A0A1S3ZKE3_TOBAC|nr:PREDICTED: centrosomal protein of 164 kDa-like [Nicotiana tabacum]
MGPLDPVIFALFKRYKLLLGCQMQFLDLRNGSRASQHKGPISSVHGLSNDVAMRPPPSDDDILTEPSTMRQDKQKKRKMAPSSPSFEKKKPRKRLAHKPKESTSARALSPDSLYRLMDESDGEEEAFDLVASVSPQLEGQGSSEPEGGEADLHQVGEAEEEVGTEASQETGKALKESLGPIEIAESPSFTESMFNEAQGAKECPVERAHREDTTGFGDLEIPRKSSPSKDARVLSAPVGVASYLRCLVTEDDQAKMNEVDAPSLFNKAQQVLNRTFLRYRDELQQIKAKVRELTEKRDAFKLLSEQFEGEVKNLRVKLEVARKEHADLVEQVQQKLDRIDQLRAKMDIVQAETNEWKGRINRLASEKEATRAQLTLAEIQLRAAKQRADVQTKKVEELQSRLGSAVLDRESLTKELKMAKSEVIVVKVEADEMVAQYNADAKAAQDLVKNIVEHMKWQSRREALKEVHARGFDLSAEIENAKVLEAEARNLAYPKEDDSEDSSRFEGGEDLENPGDELGSGQDQAA